MKKYFMPLTMIVMTMLLLLSSCKKDSPSNNTESPLGGTGNILIMTVVPNTDGMSGSQFIRLIEGLQPRVDNKEAIPVPHSSATPCIFGNDIYTFPGYLNDGKFEIVKYRKEQNRLKKVGTMKVPEKSSATNIVVTAADKGYISCAGIGKILIFNPEKMQLTGEIDLSSLGHLDKNPNTGAMIYRDGHLFVGLNQMVGGWVPPADYTNTDIAIINTQTDKLVKMISETTHNFSMATRPIDPYSIFMDENRDIYVSCLGGFGMLPNTKHKAGLLRIKAGALDFDPTYAWAITGEKIAVKFDSKHNPVEYDKNTAGFIASIRYIKDGKAYGYVDIPGYYKKGETGHNAISNMAVEIDLKNKTLHKIEGLDLSNGYGICVAPYGSDQIILGNSSKTSKGVYLYNRITRKLSEKPVIVPSSNIIMLHPFSI
ncbi:hypothetical protein HQ47_01875 [Porphyromonas macacae]|uniref:Lipoprotein n=1 Tax=Porphyromonas macacae TaxID=28115 RepID=A0A0A2EGA0_9PORP|nr:hypothetical protein [Porphyromonas macacae]KGN75454.1 hypothetical protein HQ47_01875 [Porphyromonas macacae]